MPQTAWPNLLPTVLGTVLGVAVAGLLHRWLAPAQFAAAEYKRLLMLLLLVGVLGARMTPERPPLTAFGLSVVVSAAIAGGGIALIHALGI